MFCSHCDHLVYSLIWILGSRFSSCGGHKALPGSAVRRSRTTSWVTLKLHVSFVYCVKSWQFSLSFLFCFGTGICLVRGNIFHFGGCVFYPAKPHWDNQPLWMFSEETENEVYSKSQQKLRHAHAHMLFVLCVYLAFDLVFTSSEHSPFWTSLFLVYAVAHTQ